MARHERWKQWRKREDGVIQLQPSSLQRWDYEQRRNRRFQWLSLISFLLISFLALMLVGWVLTSMARRMPEFLSGVESALAAPLSGLPRMVR